MNGRRARQAGRAQAERQAALWRDIAGDAVEALRLMQMQHPLNLLGERAIRRFEAEVDGEQVAADRRVRAQVERMVRNGRAAESAWELRGGDGGR